MSPKPRDPLLAVVRTVLVVTMGAMVVATVALALAGPFVLIFKAQVANELAANGAPAEVAWAIAGVTAIAAACAAIGFLFFRHLYRIVGTVGEGDPFIPANAERLRAMGWIVVAVHVLSIPLVALARWIESVTEQVHTDADVSLSGLLLALILFILARVFREGTRLRDEVEGTV